MPHRWRRSTYLDGLKAIHKTGEAVKETSYYGQLEGMLNDVGGGLSPAVTCVLTTKNRGAGIPDGGLFIAREAVKQAGDSALKARAPERGVMEVKGTAEDVRRVLGVVLGGLRPHRPQARRRRRRYGASDRSTPTTSASPSRHIRSSCSLTRRTGSVLRQSCRPRLRQRPCRRPRCIGPTPVAYARARARRAWRSRRR
jgi:hypothetical protein